MSRAYLNLAREPFVNTRPVVRLSIVLWVAGALLLAGNVWLYWDFLAGRGDTYSRLQQVEREIATTRGRIDSLESELAGFDLAEQNDQVAYLNARIDRRRFAWSRLFDALAEILPEDVRLTRLSPSESERSQRGSPPASSAGASSGRAEGKHGGVRLQIDAIARDDESILALVDALFEDPAFRYPNLLQQRRRDDGLIQFDIDTLYTASQTSADDAGSVDAEVPPRSEESIDPGGQTARQANDGHARESAVRLGVPASSPPEVR